MGDGRAPIARTNRYTSPNAGWWRMVPAAALKQTREAHDAIAPRDASRRHSEGGPRQRILRPVFAGDSGCKT